MKNMKRVIPILLVDGGRLIKTIQFNKEIYLGDPLNTIKLFNDMMVDEIIVLDIKASIQGKKPDYTFIEQLASECFMPVTYGGGISTIGQVKKILSLGIEKISIQSAAFDNPDFITEISKNFGCQSVVVSIDVKKNFWGNSIVCTNRGRVQKNKNIFEYIQLFEAKGAGEFLINFIDRDGTFKGYDIPYIKQIADVAHVPVVACGGASDLGNIQTVFEKTHVSAAAAGSIFVFSDKKRGILVNYPDPKNLDAICKR
jgi:cyclase